MTMSLPVLHERPALADTIEEIGFRKVRITASVTFDAYVFADHDQMMHSVEDAIGHEVADAVEYRAPHLTDSEPGDALIVAAGYANVQIDRIDTLESDRTSEQVAELAEGYAGEVF